MHAWSQSLKQMLHTLHVIQCSAFSTEIYPRTYPSHAWNPQTSTPPPKPSNNNPQTPPNMQEMRYAYGDSIVDPCPTYRPDTTVLLIGCKTPRCLLTFAWKQSSSLGASPMNAHCFQCCTKMVQPTTRHAKPQTMKVHCHLLPCPVLH